MWRKDLLAAETFYHEKGEGWTLPGEGSSEACGHLLNELFHTIFQPCGFMVVAEEFTAVFLCNENAYCPGAVVGEGSEKASSFSHTAD